MDRLILRIAQMLTYGLARETIREQLVSEYSDEEIFLCYVAARMLLE